SAIKYISQKTAPKILKYAPFNTYQELLDVMDEKGSGISTRMVGALNAVGAAAMPDNPRSGHERDNLYEYLSIPAFDLNIIPENMRKNFDKLEDFDEEGCFILLGMVKKIKRGTGWSRVEMVDDSGSAGIFHNEDTLIEPGRMYVFLVAANRIHRFIEIDELGKLENDALIKYLEA